MCKNMLTPVRIMEVLLNAIFEFTFHQNQERNSKNKDCSTSIDSIIIEIKLARPNQHTIFASINIIRNGSVNNHTPIGVTTLSYSMRISTTSKKYKLTQCNDEIR